MKYQRKSIIIAWIIFLLIVSLIGVFYFFNNDSYILKDAEQEINTNTFIGSVERFVGEEIIWEYTAENDESLKIGYLFSIDKGRVKLQLISPDGSIQDIVENTHKADVFDLAYSTVDVKKGQNKIKLVATEDAEFAWKIQIDVGVFKRLGT